MPSLSRAAAATLLAMAMVPGAASSQDEQPDNQPEKSAAPAASGGLRAYLDPATGRLIDQPPFGEPTLELSDEALYRFSTDHFGLIEERLPDGTLKVDLKGRFRAGTVATVDEDGDVQTHRIGGDMFLSPAGRRIHRLIGESRDADGNGQ